MKKDELFAQPIDEIADFEFNENVAMVFPDMLRRSIPGYSTILKMIGIISSQYVSPGSTCYDLGCSLGATTMSMRTKIPHYDCKIIAVDSSEAMIRNCLQNIQSQQSPIPVEAICSDVSDITIQNASIVVLNFILQFVKPELRLKLLKDIHDGMLPEGRIILSEKISCVDASQQQLMDSFYYAFKKAHGYSDLEIKQKKDSLKNVLIPDPLPVHIERLKNIGFKNCEVWFRCFNFISILAEK